MASIRDIILIVVLLFAFGLVILVQVNINHKVLDQLKLNPTINATQQAVTTLDKGGQALDKMDYVYFAMFLGFFLALIIFGYLVGGLEVFSVIYFLLIILFVIVAYPLQMSWIQIESSADFSTTVSSNLPLTNFIMEHLAMFTAIFGLVGLLAMYAKPYMSGGIQQ